DLWGVVWPEVQVRPEAEIYPQSACVEYLKQHRDEHMRVLDVDAPGTACTPLGDGVPLAMIDRLAAGRGYSPLAGLRFAEYLPFITGKDEPLHPLIPDNPLTFPVMTGFPSENYPLKERKLLNLLGVGYRLQPSDVPLEDPEGWEVVGTDGQAAGFDFNLGG